MVILVPLWCPKPEGGLKQSGIIMFSGNTILHSAYHRANNTDCAKYQYLICNADIQGAFFFHVLA